MKNLSDEEDNFSHHLAEIHGLINFSAAETENWIRPEIHKQLPYEHINL